MNKWEKLNSGDLHIIVLGSHPAIIQSILDFDYLSGKEKPSVVAIVSIGRRNEKFFWGKSEVLIPCYSNIIDIPDELGSEKLFALNVQSGRRATSGTREFFIKFPQALGGHIFAENVPEIESLALAKEFGEEKILVGPSGVGLLIPGVLKLGAIGGTDPVQIMRNAIWTKGNAAVVCASGGMTNEIITALATNGRAVGLALTVGGDRFPMTSPAEAFMAAEGNAGISHIVYFGELGGFDEYELATLVQEKKIKKPVIAYIAGVVDEAFGNRAQFGHAKALAEEADESAKAKRIALKNAGVHVAESYTEFLKLFEMIPKTEKAEPFADPAVLHKRTATLFTSREIVNPFDESDQKGSDASLTTIILSSLLGKPVRSKMFADFTRQVFELLIDHGPHVSGAVNTMITARAGKDLVDSLCAGLLTIGPRFGGAMNAAAETWWEGVKNNEAPRVLVDRYNKNQKLIPGIGHKKYRLGFPDPRVQLLEQFVVKLAKHPAWDFANGVAEVTTQKRGNLILNVDGAVAALLLDILVQEEGYTDKEIAELLTMEFFNTFFIIPRSIGLLAHALDQKRRDEGLFRMPENLIHMDK